MNSINAFFKSWIIRLNLIIAPLLYAMIDLVQMYGHLSFIDMRLAAALVFALTIALNKWKSFTTILNTGVNLTWAMVFFNVIGIVLMLGDYFMEAKLFDLFGVNAKAVGIFVLTLTTLLRTAFTNQPVNDTAF